MKKAIILSVAAFSIILGSCNSSSNQNEKATSTESAITDSTVTTQTFNLDTTSLKTGDIFYQCEMNHDVLSDKPGSCPKCGMELSETKKL